ncbi:TM1812 family CRISPR-associated protein [Ignicoccus hospitalis]|uniref:CRISPR-associated protein DxTHG motif n=1 Tax=Ignicoccus hospitalis (strain KIN4/I / DSM 18386 / JCM 14125) TaxID=453591 RepID=A8A9A7_IGNH4|nr:TM1812 family CRISPR-associated protein [Ignicoccus hospitalis]ABU81509.1 CRISPR-associated protein DxTHG motif [Ignicoccus hospitalis KIN4/I]HIH90444.1 CRISPR-associated DxTHG motif protein [Desulfurococcaceae archaeon]
MKALVISTWGNSRAWERVTYRPDDHLKDALEDVLEQEVTSCNVLKLFKKENTRKVVLLPISLLDEKANDLKEAEDKIKETVVTSNENDDCRKDLKEILNSSEVKIVLGSGTFLSNKVIKKFEVPFNTVLSDLYLKLYESLKEEYKRAEEELEVILDITHGVNYYPVSSRAILEKLLAVMSHRGKSRLYVASSDPFVRGRGGSVKETMNLEYHLIEKKAFPKNAFLTLAIDIEFKNVVKGKSEINDELEELKKIKKYIGLLSVPSLLAWSYLKYVLENNNAIKKAENLLLRISKELEKFSIEDDKFKFSVEFNPKSVFDLIALIEVGEALKDLKGEKNCDFFAVEFDDLNASNNKYKDLMEDVSKRLWEKEFNDLKLTIRSYERVKEEARSALEELKNIDDLRNLAVSEEKLREKVEKESTERLKCKLEELRKYIMDGWLPYSFLRVGSEVSGGGESIRKKLQEEALWWAVWALRVNRDDCSADEATVRNFVAHAGLEMNVTFVKNDKVAYYLPSLECIIEKLT